MNERLMERTFFPVKVSSSLRRPGIVKSYPFGLDTKETVHSFTEGKHTNPAATKERGRNYSWLFRIVVLLAAIISGSTSIYAQEEDSFTVGYLQFNINYNGDVDTQTVTLCYNLWGTINYYPSGKVVVPSHVEHNGKTYTVTIIDRLPFVNCSDITDIVIPNTVVYIYQYAFSKCANLQSLTIEDGDQTLWFSHSHYSENLNDLLVKHIYMGRDFRVENYQTYLSSSLFNDNKWIESVTIGGHCTTIKEGMFSGCTRLKRITIGDSVTAVEERAFINCSSLSAIDIPSSVTSIGKSSFAGCSKLSRLTLSESLEEIPESAFAYCRSLTRLNLPASVKRLDKNAFSYCGFKELYLPDTLLSFESDTFEGCASLEKVVIGDGIKSIPENAFHWGGSQDPIMKEFIIGRSVTHIGNIILEWNDYGPKIISYAQIAPEIDRQFFCGHILDTPLPLVFVTSESKGYNAGVWREEFNVKEIEPVQSIKINYQNIGDNLGMVTATVLPETATDKTIVWSSSDNNVATVDPYGIVTIKNPGETYITATAHDGSEVSSQGLLRISPVPANSISLNMSEMTLFVGDSGQLTATIEPENTTFKDVVWASDNEEVATVSEDGEVKALSVGEATITATCGSVVATCKVTVNPGLVESLSIDPTEWIGMEGESFRINASILPDNADNKTLEWTSSDEDIASVDNDGNVEVHRNGTCIITAHTTDGSDLSASCLITSTTFVKNPSDTLQDSIEIYNLHGICVMVTTDENFKERLITGVYIIKRGSELEKIIIK